MTVIQCDKCGKVTDENFRAFRVKLNVSMYTGIEPCPCKDKQNVEIDLCEDCYKELEETLALDKEIE